MSSELFCRNDKFSSKWQIDQYQHPYYGWIAFAVKHDLISRCGMALWRHQMETFSTLLAFCAGNSPETGEFPAQNASDLANVSIWWRHNAKSPASLLSTQLFVQEQIKENIKAPHHLPLWGISFIAYMQGHKTCFVVTYNLRQQWRKTCSITICYQCYTICTLRWRHNERDGVSKSPANRLFTQPFVQLTKGTFSEIKILYTVLRQHQGVGDKTSATELPSMENGPSC